MSEADDGECDEMNEIQHMIERIRNIAPIAMKELLSCKDAAYAAMESNPDNVMVNDVHRLFWEAELAVLQAQEILVRMERIEHKKEPG